MADNSQATLYLASAKTTVTYIEGKMVVGASNKISLNLLSAAMCVGWGGMTGEMREAVDTDMSGIGIPPGTGAGSNMYWKRRIEIEAFHAKRFGCGNCGEQASSAFIHLRDNGIKPRDYYEAESTFSRHAFVIVGRDKSTNATDYTTWNKDAVMCDPWRGVADFVTAQTSYFSGKKLTLHYRED